MWDKVRAVIDASPWPWLSPGAAVRHLTMGGFILGHDVLWDPTSVPELGTAVVPSPVTVTNSPWPLAVGGGTGLHFGRN